MRQDGRFPIEHNIRKLASVNWNQTDSHEHAVVMLLSQPQETTSGGNAHVTTKHNLAT